MEELMKPDLNQEDLQAIYLEAIETTSSVEEINRAMDNLDPVLDTLIHHVEIYNGKKQSLRTKLSQIMAKM